MSTRPRPLTDRTGTAGSARFPRARLALALALSLGLAAGCERRGGTRPAARASAPVPAAAAARPPAREVEAVKRRLREMVAADQDARRNGKAWAEIDRANTEEMKALFQRHGWIRISVFGAEADHDAWLLVQHADHDPAFQRQVLARLEALAFQGETSKRNFAYLHDRVAIKPAGGGASNSGIIEIGAAEHPAGRQRYGTQGSCVGARWEPFPLEDPAQVDRRRASVGLRPLGESLKQIRCQ